MTLDIPERSGHEAPRFLLQVRYPEDYPDSAPHLDMLTLPNAPPHPDFGVADDRERLLASLGETVRESLGMAMVFTLVSALKESAEQLVHDRREAAARAHDEALLAAEREENKKFHGTPVTPQTFLEWRDAFLREMQDKERRDEEERLADLKKAKVKEPVRMTGQQLWERGLAGKGDEGDDDEGLPTEGLAKLQMEAS